MTFKIPNFMTFVTLKESAQSVSNPFHEINNECLLIFEQVLQIWKD